MFGDQKGLEPFKKMNLCIIYMIKIFLKFSLLIVLVLLSIPWDYNEVDNYNELENSCFLLHEKHWFGDKYHFQESYLK